jgi:hypothetical protein
MMWRTIIGSRPVQIAAVALVLAMAALAYTGTRAARLEAVPVAPAPSFATEAALAPRPSPQVVDIGGVVGLNVFSPDRRAPQRRYRLTGYAELPQTPPPPEPVVLGTSVADGGRSFAFATVGGGAPKIVRVGDSIEGYVVRSIERGVVVFTTPSGERLTVLAR